MASSSSSLQAPQPAAVALRSQQRALPTTTTPPTPPTIITSPSPLALRRPNVRKASGLAKTVTASTPNLRTAYLDSSAASATTPKFTPPNPLLQRKASHAALTHNFLATIPDVSESYALATLNGAPHPPPSPANSSSNNNKMVPAPLTPRGGGAQFGSDVLVGDTVDVPGEMQGTVRFVGSIPGKKGVFAGVELQPDFAPRGKNNGDVDGVSYFSTNIPGAGIFLPLSKAIKRDVPPNTSTPSAASGLRAGTHNSTNQTPSNPSASQFNKSAAPNRAPSPRKMRPSLSHPESPGRRPPGPRPSLGPPGKNMPRFGGSPTQTKFAPGMRGPATPNDPAKRGMLQPSRNFSVGPRSGSALSARSIGFTTEEDSLSPNNNNLAGFRDIQRPGSSHRQQGPSRQAMVQDEEIERLRFEVAERDRQLKEQAATLTEMEHSLTEVQSLMDQADLPASGRRDSLGDKDTTQLRSLLKEKNEKIAMLTAEFDSHRADFRSTIDTLELASAETERVYEKRIEELMHDLQHIAERESDVDAVAAQLKQLEELVQELEEGLEDARRGEAEARGEVEFLRGEVERTRAELKREREKAATGAASGPNNMDANAGRAGDQAAMLKELEQKEDEIRGLKAIIHSLSRDSVPDDIEQVPSNSEDTAAREKVEREVAELRALLDTKNSREAELEHELSALRRGSTATLQNTDRSSVRDSRDTVVLADKLERLSLSSSSGMPQQAQRKAQHNRVRTLDTMPESDGLSSITEHSTLWCELCESAGHDILACTNMFGNQATNGAATKVEPALKSSDEGKGGLTPVVEHDRYKIAPLSPRVPFTAAASSSSHEADEHYREPAEPPAAVVTPAPPHKPAGPPPSLLEPGPVAGKESGVIDPDAWCALCEKDGHNSVDCPFEDAF